ncbi:hypothetical protein QFZ91_000262 [Paraburkholderia sp. JPY419]
MQDAAAMERQVGSEGAGLRGISALTRVFLQAVSWTLELYKQHTNRLGPSKEQRMLP